MRQQIVSATCNPVWQTITPHRRWAKPPCHISCRACKPCSASRRLADFLAPRRHVMRQKYALGYACTDAWRQQYAAYADATHYAAERLSAFSLLSKTLRHFGDSNSVGETTLILTINTGGRGAYYLAMHYSLSLVGKIIVVYHALTRVLGNDKRFSGELPLSQLYQSYGNI